MLVYTGVDLSKQAMHIGEQNVRPNLVPNIQLSFIVDDMLNFVKKAESTSYDLVFSSLAVHHLQDNEKQQLLREVRRLLKPNGVFMLIDLFLQEDEDHDNFAKDIAAHIRNDWVKLTPEERESLVNHMFNFDFPVKFSVYEQWTKQDSLYTNVQCLESLRFYITTVLEA